MKIIFRIIWMFVALYFFANAVHWELRLSNYFLVDSREHLKLINKCSLTSEITVRQYVFRGSSATTSDSNSVYVQMGKSPFERSIWGAYSSPFIKEMKCLGDKLILVTDSYDPEFAEYNFTVEQIKSDLVKNPVRLYKGRYETEEDARNKKGFDITILIINLVCALVPALLAFRITPKVPLGH